MYEMLNSANFTPEYTHVILNHIPIVGIAGGIFVLVLGLVLGSSHVRCAGYSLIMICSLSVWAITASGDRAYDRVSAKADDDGTAWLDAHVDRAEGAEAYYYLLAGFCFVSLLTERYRPRLARPFAIGVVLGSCGMVAVGAWIAFAGGKTMHSEFRHSPPPTTEKNQSKTS